MKAIWVWLAVGVALFIALIIQARKDIKELENKR